MAKYIPIKALAVIAIIAAISTVAFATSVGVTTTTYQAENGVEYIVTGNLTVNAVGFEVAPVAEAASSSPVSWVTNGYAQTAITAGDWIYNVTVTLTSSTAASTSYTITVSWNQNGAGLKQIGSITFTTPSSITSGEEMTFSFDTGLTTFTAPSGIVITVG
ncbi:MAG: hypothetical protein QXH66_03950 [Conexivisphaerales archaeon]